MRRCHARSAGDEKSFWQPLCGNEGKTGWTTNDESLFQEISRVQCFSSHAHEPKPVPLLKERHGVWVKEELKQELANGTETPGTIRELDFVLDDKSRMPHKLSSDDRRGGRGFKNMGPDLITDDNMVGEFV